MPISTRFATATAVVAAGWTDPTYAMRFDNSYAYSETNNAEQTYSGYNLNLTGTETLDKVFARIKYTSKVTTVLQGDDSTSTMTLRVYNGSTWQNYQITKQVFSVSTIPNAESLTDTVGDNSNSDTYIDITSFINTKAKLANVQFRLLYTVTADAGITVRWSVDGISLLACYHTIAGVMARGRATTKYTNPTATKALQAVNEFLTV